MYIPKKMMEYESGINVTGTIKEKSQQNSFLNLEKCCVTQDCLCIIISNKKELNNSQ